MIKLTEENESRVCRNQVYIENFSEVPSAKPRKCQFLTKNQSNGEPIFRIYLMKEFFEATLIWTNEFFNQVSEILLWHLISRYFSHFFSLN